MSKMTLEQAVKDALEAERFAALFYDELAHVAKLEVIQGGASAGQLSRDLPRAMLERHAPGDRTRRT